MSNSSMQTTPPSASTMAPPSMMKPRVTGSRRTEAVSPAALLPFPEVYTWRGRGWRSEDLTEDPTEDPPFPNQLKTLSLSSRDIEQIEHKES